MLIKIFGGKGEGKSTVAKYLEEALKDCGFQVENLDDEAEKIGRLYEKKLAIMKEAAQKGDILKIEIKTIPYGRETLPQYAQGTQGNGGNGRKDFEGNE